MAALLSLLLFVIDHYIFTCGAIVLALGKGWLA
jgi:hypothetical protein